MQKKEYLKIGFSPDIKDPKDRRIFHMNKNKKENLNYFCGKEKKFLSKYSDYRTKFFLPISKILIKLGITADLLSYIGLLILIGFIYFVKKDLILASIFILIHVLIDAFDGPLAKARQEASNSGAITDIVCDHSGMVIVVLGLIYANLVNPIPALIYVYIYTVLIFLVIVRNMIKKPIRAVFRSKYWLYAIFAIYALWGVNFLNIATIVFIFLMVPPLISSYIVIKKYLKK